MKKVTRREAITTMAVGGAGLLAACAPQWGRPASDITTPPTGRRPDRFSTAMWDFSWATRRSGQEAEYQDWDQVLDQLADRGYDNVRIDAFPYLVANDRKGRTAAEFTLLPQRARFMWGNHSPVQINPRQDLIQFMRKCSERKISVGLSSWYVPDTAGRYLEVREPRDFARIWDETLRVIDAAGLLGTIRWVDLCNEFPLDVWARGAAKTIFGQSLPTLLGAGFRGVPWPKMWATRTQAFLTDAIQPLKANWPMLKFCYSFNDIPGPYLRALDVSTFDVAEVHCWITDDIAWSMSSLQLASLLEIPRGQELHARRVMATPLPELRRWFDEYLDPKMATWSAWASENRLPLITTEGWGPTNYADVPGLDGEWRWVREFAEIAVHKAIERGWTGICTSNFCQPHHQGMWADRSWHRELTSAIRGA